MATIYRYGHRTAFVMICDSDIDNDNDIDVDFVMILICDDADVVD